jgi:diacylglycerol kinase (ATP)
MKKKYLFIVNPASKIIDKNEIERIISRFAEKYRFNWKIYFTEKENSKARIGKQITRFNPDLIIVAGGDGTINQVAGMITGTSIELGIIPAGSANGLAYNLEIPPDIEEALNIIMTAKAKAIDAIRINDEICLHLSDAGFNARIVKRFEEEGSKGLLGYGKQMLKEIFSKKKKIAFDLYAKNARKRYKVQMVVIANARMFGTGAIINPIGLLDDGEFEIIIIRLYKWWMLFYIIRMFFSGKTDKLQHVRVIKTDRAEITFEKMTDIQIDGEIINGVGKLDISIIPSAVKIRYM